MEQACNIMGIHIGIIQVAKATSQNVSQLVFDSVGKNPATIAGASIMMVNSLLKEGKKEAEEIAQSVGMTKATIKAFYDKILPH